MITIARTIVILILMVGCVSTHRDEPQSYEPKIEISETNAVEMIAAGDVRTVFVPHNGLSTILLRDGTRFYVHSGYEVLENMEKLGLKDRVEHVYIE